MKVLFGKKNCKSDKHKWNTELFFVLWNEVKDIWCTNKLFVLFCVDFINCCNKSALFWFQEFEQKHYVYWTVCVSFLNNGLFSITCKAKVIFDSFKVFLSERWGYLVKSVGYWERYILKQGNPVIFFQNHSQLPNT